MTTVIIKSGNTDIATDKVEFAALMLQMLREEALEAASSAVGTRPAIGTEWPEQGGIYLGVMRGRDGHPDYDLIVAKAESDTKLKWGAHGEDSKATSKWDGLANTRVLIEEGDHPAAEYAAGITIDGHSDFYLPAQAELMLAWTNAPEVFSEGWHWSSTQYSSYTAFNVDFYDGYTPITTKPSSFRVRPVRRILR